MEKKLRRLLAVFFILMAFFTVVSRAAASVMAAKVQVAAIKNGELTYRLSGIGTVKENAKKYIDLKEGLKAGKVYVAEGQPVEKGDLLFQYDMEQLNEKKASLSKELNQLWMEYEKAALDTPDTDGSGQQEAAEMAVRNAKEDLKAAKQELEDKKEEIAADKKKAYQEAVSDTAKNKDSKMTEINNAKRAAADAKLELEELEQPLEKLAERFNQYKRAVTAGKEEDIAKAVTEIFDFYYKGAYDEHLEEKSDAQEEVDRASRDLTDIKKKWNKAIDEEDRYSSEIEVQKAYYAQVAARKEEVKNAGRKLDDAKKKLDKITKADEQITIDLENYQKDIENFSPDLENTYDSLYQILYENLKVDERKIEKAQLNLRRAREDEEALQVQWEKKIKVCDDKTAELAGQLKKINDGSYDYKSELTEADKAVHQAEQTLKDAQLSLKKVKTDQKSVRENKKLQERTQELDLKIRQLDLDEKKEELKKLTDILSKEGKVYAPAEGSVKKNDLEQGDLISGQEKLAIGSGGYELTITAGKEDMKHFIRGDEIEISIDADNKITSRIENLELPDAEENVTFTAILPEGHYQENSSLDYEMEKESDSYPVCIALQAIRQDSRSTYVLLVKEKDGVLGKEETAFRINVTVISQDDKTAAIEASLTKEDQIITGSSKNISEGDRVRIYEMD